MDILKIGSQGELVLSLQSYMSQVGYPNIIVNGVFDEKLDAIVRDFQKTRNLTVDGMVGSKTMLSLLKMIKGLTQADIERVAADLTVAVPSIKAIFEVESGGFGFLENSKPKILFEGHVFWKMLVKKGIDPAPIAEKNPDILYKSWTREFYRRGMDEWTRLDRARAIDNEAAISSASYGTFQIMGLNYKLCGYNNVLEFYDNQFKKEVDHLRDLANFVTKRGLLVHLQNQDWAKFAEGYNGPAYKQNRYDEKLAAAFGKHSV